MDPSIIPTVLAIFILLLMGAFFAASETAFTGLSRITVRQMVKNNGRNASKISRLKNNLEFLISTVLIGTNFVTTLNSSLSAALALKIFGEKYVSTATAVIAVLVIVFVEIIPKTYAQANTSIWAINSAPILLLLEKIFFPVICIFYQFTRIVDKLEKIIIKEKKPVVTEEELKTLIALGENEGTLEQDEKKMLDRIFQFSDLSVHDIMRHRSLVCYLNVNDNFENTIQMFHDTGYSRIPVYEGTEENIIGLLHFKSVLFADRMITASKDFIRICMKEVLFVPETLSAVELLQKFKKEKNNFAVAVTEYGNTAGIVTLDDILQEVFGRITDEHGYVEIEPEKQIKFVSINEFLVPGEMKIDDLNSILYMDLESQNFDTLGGWLLEKIGELPPIGAYYKYNGNVFIVEDQSSRRIRTVRICQGNG